MQFEIEYEASPEGWEAVGRAESWGSYRVPARGAFEKLAQSARGGVLPAGRYRYKSVADDSWSLALSVRGSQTIVLES